MKFLEKLALILFSLMISVLSITLILIMLNVVEINIITKTIALIIRDEFYVKLTIGISAVALLLAIKCIFFGAEPEDDGRNGVTLENDSGKLVISKEGLENIIANIVKDVQGIEAISSRTILDKHNSLIVYVTTLVSKDMMIKDVSIQIQNRIKDALSKTADLEVKQVNVKVKNITNKKIKGLPEAENINVQDTNAQETKEVSEEE